MCFPLRLRLRLTQGRGTKSEKPGRSLGVTADEDIIEQPRLIIDIALTRRLLITPGYFFYFFPKVRGTRRRRRRRRRVDEGG